MLYNVKRVYQLQDFTVECKNGKWWYWRTSRYGDKEERKGPYSSEYSVCLMLARALRKEIIKRDAPFKLPE